MTVKEIIQIENGNRNTIILLREGIFWRAYEKSAYAFSMQVHPYKPTRKWVIAVKQDVVSLGFPVSAAENVLNGCKVLMRQEARLVLAASPIDPDGFEVWKQTVHRSLPPAVVAPVPAAASPVMAPAASSAASSVVSPAVSAVGQCCDGLADCIRRFNIESKTPVDCMLFLMELKRKLAE